MGAFHTKPSLLIAVLISSLSAVLVAPVFASARPARRTIEGAHPIKHVVKLDPGIHETIKPPAANAHPAITADQAWHRYSKSAGHAQSKPRQGVKSWIGLYTLPTSDRGPKSQWTYTAHNELVYAFESPTTGCLNTGTNPPKHPAGCREWTMLVANTGRMINSTYQKETQSKRTGS